MSVASLMMYDRPDVVRGANDALWTGIRDRMRRAGFDAPDALDRLLAKVRAAV